MVGANIFNFATCVVFVGVLVSGCGSKFSRENFSNNGFTNIVFSSSGQRAANLTEQWLEHPETYDPQAGDFFTEAFASGTAMIFATNTTDNTHYGRKYITSPAAGATINWSIPNGTYNFHLIGYSGSTIGNTTYCAAASSESLTGGTKTVSLNTTSVNCQASPYNPGTVTSFQVNVCTAGSVVSGASVGSANCAALGSGAAHASIGSITVKYYEEDEFGGFNSSIISGANSLPSGCLALTTGTTDVSGAGVPMLSDAAQISTVRIRAEIVFFSGASCGTFDSVYSFPLGFSSAGTVTGIPTMTDGTSGTNLTTSAKYVYSAGTAKMFIAHP